MQIELLKEIVSVVSGPGSVDIVDLLYKKRNVNEFLIAKKLDMTINQARNILYKLADVGLVSFVRKKDKKNGGWYTYFWTLDVEKSLVALRKSIGDRVENLELQLRSKKTKRFYYSPEINVEYSEETALEHNFICPETGEVMQLKDNTEDISNLTAQISESREFLEKIDSEIEDLRKKLDISKGRRRKLEEKKKKAERDAKRKAREKEKKKLAKKMGKKSVKKKPKKKPSKKKKAASSRKKKNVKKAKKPVRRKVVKKSSKKKSFKKKSHKFSKKKKAFSSRKKKFIKKLVKKRLGKKIKKRR